MLIDTTTNANYSSRHDAVRKIGLREFNKKVKKNELDEIQIGFFAGDEIRAAHGKEARNVLTALVDGIKNIGRALPRIEIHQKIGGALNESEHPPFPRCFINTA